MNKYQQAQVRQLVGKTIVDVQFVDGFPVLVLNNDVCAVIQRDDEGNGPGSIMFQKANGEIVDIMKVGR